MFHTQGIVLNKNYYKEFDEIFTVYTRDFGKIEILGRGVKRPLAKLNSHLQVFDCSEVEFVLGKKFKVLTGANFDFNLLSCCENSISKNIIKSFADIIDDFVDFDCPDGNLWNLLLEFSDFLKGGNNIAKVKSNVFLNFFKFKLISLCGFEPVLDKCVLCRGKLKETKTFFSLKGGGLICGVCGNNDDSSFLILSSTVKLLRIFLSGDKDLILKLKVSKTEYEDIQKTIDRFTEWIVGY